MGRAWRTSFDHKKAELIAHNLWEHVLDLETFEKTATLTRYRCLREVKARRCFKWCLQVHSNRFFTDKAVSEGIALLFRQHNLSLPEVPGLSWKPWLKSETARIGDLCRRARRAMAADPSQAETQNWQYQDTSVLRVAFLLGFYSADFRIGSLSKLDWSFFLRIGLRTPCMASTAL